jgi:hypothetical protein
MSYDSTSDTKAHIRQVQRLIEQVRRDLMMRAFKHDRSKLRPPEKEIYDEFTPKLAATTYGSEEYKRFLVEMGSALEHHYAVNDHHPEHHEHGVRDMDLLQVVEMLADWKAASLRHDDGDLGRSIGINVARFDIDPSVERLIWNTADRMGWL